LLKRMSSNSKEEKEEKEEDNKLEELKRKSKYISFSILKNS